MKKTLAGMATLALLFFLPMFSVYAAGMSLSADQQWIDGLSANIEYITEETYKVQSADTANNPHWTSLSGGTRPNGTKYASFWLVEGHKLQVASAWYGKNIYFRPKGTTGKGTVIAVPDYSQLKEPYKKAIRIFNAYPSDTGDSFYASYLRSISDKNSYLSETIEKVNIDISMASIVNFNKAPNNYLTDAEGNYIYDLVAIGANVLEEPDLSGAAAWALKEYIRDGYGFLVGHDTMYGYGGVNSNPNYVPDKSSTVTPIYELNTNNNGHWNMNWLMGVNKLYTESHPYDAASLILNLGDWHDKSTLYGDTTEKVSISTVRIAAKSQGNTTDNVTARCPTNYPYNSTVAGNLFSVGSNIFSGATHTNQQLAYGKVWIDFVSNTSDGKLIVDKNGGMIGTNNFYLTTNGNFGMMQIGHSKDNLTAARPDEARILANTILYLSQREPCGVCQSKQDSNTVVHSVKRISSAAELANIGNSAMWYTYPLSGCYVLTDDIVLPTDWKPIENFCGHFNADGHDITANGKAVFAQNGVLGANLGGWNLGINPDKGINRIASGNGTTTATARVVGHLNQLFGTDSSTDYSLYNVKIAGSDGKEYDCVTNREGKYIVSNVPCTGKKMVAKVFDSTGREITEYGGIYAQVKQDAWNTNETVPMQLTRNGLRPVPNQIIYEDEDAVFVGGINSQTLPQKTKWQYRGGAGDTWKNVEDSTFFECEISSVEMVAADTPYAQTKLTIKNAQLTIDKLQFRAVFTLSGEEYNTFDAKTENAAGLLRVKEQPYKLSPIKNVNTWQGETVDLVVDFEYYRKMHNPAGCGWWHGAPIFFTPNCQFPQELEVRWQYRGNKDCTWENLDDSPIITDYKAWTSYYEVTGKPTEQLGYKSNAFLRLNNVSTDINGYEFRAILEYKQKSRVFSTDSVATADAVGRVTVRPKLIQCVAQPKNLKAQTNGSTALGTYEYATEFEYVAPTPYINVVWEYKTNAADTYKDIKTFPYQNVAATHVNISTEVSPNVYRVKAILTLTNPPNDLDIGRNHFYFRAKATSNSILGYSNSADFSLNYKVDIKPGTPVVRMSADGQTKVYTYPSLTVFAPEGVRNFQVSFAPDSMAAKNKMASPQNLGGSAALAADKGFIYNSNTSLSARTVRDFLRQVQITVSSEKANVKWYISSERFAGEFDPYSGKYYEYVAAPGTTWTQSFDAARNRYHNALQAQGKLATIKNNEQNNLVQRLVGSSYAWIGATNDRGYLPCENWGQYLWVDGSALSYDRLTSKPSGNNYAQMQPSGAWLAARNTQSSTATVTDLINYNGYEHGGWYVKSGIFQGTTPEGTNNNQGYTGLLLLAPDSTWGVDTIVAHSVYLENGHLYW
ncbi:MAG: C-type lectin domain-containing protein, partial [Oscillospiraceae bacterium]